jgi:predicted HTH transcriptional regulator
MSERNPTFLYSTSSERREDEAEVIAYLNKFPIATSNDIAMECHMSKKQAEAILTRIRKNHPDLVELIASLRKDRDVEEQQLVILQIMRETPTISRKEIRDLTGYDRITVNNRIAHLKEKGILKLVSIWEIG